METRDEPTYKEKVGYLNKELGVPREQLDDQRVEREIALSKLVRARSDEEPLATKVAILEHDLARGGIGVGSKPTEDSKSFFGAPAATSKPSQKECSLVLALWSDQSCDIYERDKSRA